MDKTRIPFIQVRDNCLIYYEQLYPRSPRGTQPPRSRAYSGDMTEGGKKRLKKAIDILLQKAQPRTVYNSVLKFHHTFRLNFVTLTVSDHRNISINEGYKNLLKPFLRKIRKSQNLSYIWKAEFQERGQLHYHLTTNQFLPWQVIRQTWNNLQRKHRYLDTYALKHGHFDANSTDVHAVRKVKDLAAYLSKYMIKPVIDPAKQRPDQEPVFEKGKVWDCSTDLKQDRFSYIMDSRTDAKLRQGIAAGTVKVVELEHCTIFKTASPTQLLPVSEYKQYLKWRS